MKPANELSILLQEYLGELIQILSQTYEYYEQQRIKRHIEAIEILLMINRKS